MPFAARHPKPTTALLRRLVAGFGLQRQGAAGSSSKTMQTLGAPPGPTVG